MRRNLAIIGLLVLSGMALEGCAETVSRGIVEASYLADTATNYVHEVHSARLWFRMECFEIFKERVKELRDANEPMEASALLIAGYPQLVTVSILRGIYKDKKSILSEPFGCLTPPEDEELLEEEASEAVDNLS